MKKPWLAVLLSFILPGIGQMYVGHHARGWIILGSYTISYFTLYIFIGILLVPIVWIYGIINAYNLAKRTIPPLQDIQG